MADPIIQTKKTWMVEEKKRLEERVEKYKKVIADELSLMAKLGE